MPILVKCTECNTGFKVNEKFAGKQGPCPKCKAVIRVPAIEEAPPAAEAVKIHAPEEFAEGGKDKKGRLVTKPASREDARFETKYAIMIGGAVLGVLIVAWIVGRSMTGQTNLLLMFVSGLILLVSAPVSLAGYWILRNDEREPYQGAELYMRSAITAGVYCLLWPILGYVTWLYPGLLDKGWNWLFVGPPFVALGALAAYLAFDLETGESTFHFAFFVVVSVALRWLAGMTPL
jgi:hypothetical protein